MAGEIKQGFPENNEAPDENEETKPVLVETAAFTTEAIALYDMPGEAVLDMLSTSGLQQMPKLVSLFKLSINDAQKAEFIPLLTFSELTLAVRVWVEKSSERVILSGTEGDSGLFNIFDGHGNP